MPEMDGFELAQMVRQHPRYQKTAIIFVSAVHMTDLDRLKGYEIGAIDYIQVPVVPEILRTKVSVLADLFRKSRQLETLNRELEHRVEERTAALAEAMAGEREARIAAEAAIQVRDEFLSVAAHELKTPLTGLVANAQYMARKLQRTRLEVPDWLSNGLSIVDEQSGRLSRLVGQLLDVTWLDRHKDLVEHPATDLTALAHQIAGSFASRQTRYEIVVTGEDDVVAEVEPESIAQVLTNLLENAIKYSPDGGAIEIEVTRSGTESIRLAVRDHGIGIPLEKRASIFERFYQAHAEDHRSGLGLGLYIIQQIVAKHGGEITAEFPADGGTRFVVRLPVNTPTSEAATAP
jgi:two-component system, sensor histidine kinase